MYSIPTGTLRGYMVFLSRHSEMSLFFFFLLFLLRVPTGTWSASWFAAHTLYCTLDSLSQKGHYWNGCFLSEWAICSRTSTKDFSPSWA